MADNFDIATRDGDRTLRAVEADTDIFQPVQRVAPHMPTPVGTAQYNQTVTSSVFTQTVPSGATHCLISVRGDAVHYTEDGTAPSATAGIYLPAGFLGELPIPQALKFHRVATDAIIAVTYRKYP